MSSERPTGGDMEAGPSRPRADFSRSTRQTPVADESRSGDQLPELPWAFIECPTDDLVVLIAHMLNRLMEHNDQVILTPESLTRFHSRAPPQITVIDYLRRIVKYTNLEKLPLLSLLAYIDLTCATMPSFTLSSLTVHRFLISGVTAGSKALCDVFCTNGHYAKVGGIKVGELNALEREFLKVTDWNLCVHAELLQQYYTSLIRSHGGYRQASEPATKPFTTFPLPRPKGPETPSVPTKSLQMPPQETGDANDDPERAEAETNDDGMDVDDEMVATDLTGGDEVSAERALDTTEPKSPESRPPPNVEQPDDPPSEQSSGNTTVSSTGDAVSSTVSTSLQTSSGSRGSNGGDDVAASSGASPASSHRSLRPFPTISEPASPRVDPVVATNSSSSSVQPRKSNSLSRSPLGKLVGGFFRVKSQPQMHSPEGHHPHPADDAESPERGRPKVVTPRIRGRRDRSADPSTEDLDRAKRQERLPRNEYDMQRQN